MAFAKPEAECVTDARVVSLIERRPSEEDVIATGGRVRISWVASDVRIVANPLCTNNAPCATTPSAIAPLTPPATPKQERPILPLRIDTSPEVVCEDIIDLYTDDGIFCASPLEMDADDYAGLMLMSRCDCAASSDDYLLDDLVDAYLD